MSSCIRTLPDINRGDHRGSRSSTRPKVYHGCFATEFASRKSYVATKLFEEDRHHRLDHCLSSKDDSGPSSLHRLDLQKLSANERLDALERLQMHPAPSELEATQIELNKLNREITSLEEDRSDLVSQLRQRLEQKERAIQMYERKSVQQKVARRFLSRKDKLGRGLFFRFHMEVDDEKAFHSRCGGPGKADNVEYFALTGCCTSTEDKPTRSTDVEDSMYCSGFFLRRDNGKTYHHGCLPPNLVDRLERAKSSSPTSKETDAHHGHGRTRRRKVGIIHDPHEMKYLATGPPCRYYVELFSGECWWVYCEERELHDVFMDFQVRRVAFGEDVDSWIVLGHDGRCAWRGLPLALHNKLRRRDPSLPAPCEVSLGPGGSWFVKFFDGTTDYCLPAKVASECEDIVSKGGRVTNVSLQVNSDSYIIRHTNWAYRDSENSDSQSK